MNHWTIDLDRVRLQNCSRSSTLRTGFVDEVSVVYCEKGDEEQKSVGE